MYCSQYLQDKRKPHALLHQQREQEILCQLVRRGGLSSSDQTKYHLHLSNRNNMANCLRPSTSRADCSLHPDEFEPLLHSKWQRCQWFQLVMGAQSTSVPRFCFGKLNILHHCIQDSHDRNYHHWRQSYGQSTPRYYNRRALQKLRAPKLDPHLD